jgi:hypothetical protein
MTEFGCPGNTAYLNLINIFYNVKDTSQWVVFINLMLINQGFNWIVIVYRQTILNEAYDSYSDI